MCNNRNTEIGRVFNNKNRQLGRMFNNKNRELGREFNNKNRELSRVSNIRYSKELGNFQQRKRMRKGLDVQQHKH